MKELVFRGITTRDPEQIRWIGLASNRTAPTEILLLLVSTDLPGVLESLSRRPLPLPVRDYLIDYWRRTGKAFPLQFPAPEDVLRELAMSPGPGARAVAAEAPSIPIELLAVLARDPVTEVRLVVSARDDLPQDLAEILVQDPDSYVRRHVAAKVGPQWLPVLARDPEPAIRVFVAATPETNAELLDELAHDEDPWVRRTLEERRSGRERPKSNYVHKPLPVSAEAIAAKPAADPDTPPEVLGELALGDHNLLVLLSACWNPSLPIPVMWRIVEPLRQA